MSAIERTVDDGSPLDPVVESTAWYEREVPSIVAGLQASRTISPTTATDAWRLIETGAYDRALSVVLRDVL